MYILGYVRHYWLVGVKYKVLSSNMKWLQQAMGYYYECPHVTLVQSISCDVAHVNHVTRRSETCDTITNVVLESVVFLSPDIQGSHSFKYLGVHPQKLEQLCNFMAYSCC